MDWCGEFKRDPEQSLADTVQVIVTKARTTELCAAMFVLYEMHRENKVQLRASWRAPVARFMSHGVGNMPVWLAARYEAAVKLR